MSQWQIQVTIFLSGTDVTLSEYFEESNYKKKMRIVLIDKTNERWNGNGNSEFIVGSDEQLIIEFICQD